MSQIKLFDWNKDYGVLCLTRCGSQKQKGIAFIAFILEVK